MLYLSNATTLVNGNYITINRGDIIVGLDMDLATVVVLRIVKNQRDF